MHAADEGADDARAVAEHVAAVQADVAGRARIRAGPDPRRERHRQGTRRTGAPRARPEGRSAVPLAQLRRDDRPAPRVGTVRARPWRVPDRASAIASACSRRRGPERSFSTTSPRCPRPCRRSSCASAGTRGAPHGRSGGSGRRCTRARRRLWRCRGRHHGARVPPGSVLPPRRLPDSRAAAARASSGHPPARRALLRRRECARRPDGDHLERCHRAPASAGLARQCPGAGKRDRTTRRLRTSPRHRGCRHRPRRRRLRPARDAPVCGHADARRTRAAISRVCPAAVRGQPHPDGGGARHRSPHAVPDVGPPRGPDHGRRDPRRQRRTSPAGAGTPDPFPPRSRCVRLAATRRSHVPARPVVAVASPLPCGHRCHSVRRGPLGRQPAHGRPGVVLRPAGTRRRPVRHRSPRGQDRL